MSTKYRSSKNVPLEVIVSRLKELSDAVTGGRESLAREFTMRIPAECDRDADLVIGEAASRITSLQSENLALQKQRERLIAALEQTTSELADEIQGKYSEDDLKYPSRQRSYWADIGQVTFNEELLAELAANDAGIRGEDGDE